MAQQIHSPKVPINKKNFIEILNAKGFTQRDLAFELGCVPQNLNRYISEGLISEAMLRKCALILGVSYGQLRGFQDVPEAERLPVILDEGAFLPTRAHETDAGLDLYSPIATRIPDYGSRIIDTGVHVQLPPGTAGLLVSKSGLNTKHNITSTGLIDEGYTGTIHVKLYNHGMEAYNVRRGDKISQLVIIDVEHMTPHVVTSFEETDRGDNGFGSSGR